MLGRIARFVARFLPPCNLKRFTGLPCPTCGSGRAVIALCEGDWRGAFLVNPLFVAGLFAGSLWVLVAVPLALSGRRWYPVLPPRTRIPLGISLLVLLLLNWAYLWRNGI